MARGCGCLPMVLGGILLALWFGGGGQYAPPLEVESYDPRSPRRPAPEDGERYVIEDKGAPQDSVGTAFAIDSDGIWLTAEHVTAGCDRLGLADGRYARGVSRIVESRQSDAALIRDGLPSATVLPLGADVPQPGATGYHMGFPANEPTVVFSELIGATNARRGLGGLRSEPILAWAERARVPDGDGPLSGISGGPTLDSTGRVVGINSAATDRRGRVLTTDPRAIAGLVDATASVDERPPPGPIADRRAAVAWFTQWLDAGAIRQIYCDVN